TLGALAVTSRPAFRAPFAPYLHPHVRRVPFGCPPEALASALAVTSGGAANPGSSGPSSGSATSGAPGTSVRGPAGAVLVEPIVGREGALLPPPGWLAGVARLCREAGAVLIADEIFTGFGRTGSLFAVEAEGVRPDILCCGKALGGGL